MSQALEQTAPADLREIRNTLQETMNFLGAIAAGVEAAVGPTANSITYVAGKNLGRRFAEDAKRTEDLQEALAEVRRVLQANDCMWLFETFKPSNTDQLIEHTKEGDVIKLVFRDCMIRQSLFMFGHAQRGSLCTMMYGFFSGALEKIMGQKSKLEIVHAGENACFKQLTVERKQ